MWSMRRAVGLSPPVSKSAARARKIYIGWVVDTGVGSSPDADVSMVPMYSGYRDEDTLDLRITLDYDLVISRNLAGDPSRKREDFRVLVPMSEIVSVRLFDEDVYKISQWVSSMCGIEVRRG